MVRPPARRSYSRSRRWPYVVAGVVVIVVIAAIIATRISVNYYVITPGSATPVSQFIEVPQSENHPLTGKILLTDVFVTQLNALELSAVQVLRLQQPGHLGYGPARTDAG